MIAKGNLHAHGTKLAAYLTTGKDGERAELVELRGFVADNIRDAFIDVQIQAEATNATKPFFHAYVRLPENETLNREQWQQIADRMEKQLGFKGQGRAVAFHHGENGETHMHVAWSRIDLETMTAIDPGLYKNKMKELCREVEKEFGLTLVANERGADDKTKSAGRGEFEQSRRLGTNLKDIRTTIHECWQSADNGRAFAAALDQHGLILARGDKRDFVVIDRDGGDHALSKRITGATAAETRTRMADIDRAALPSVDQAKEHQANRAREAKPNENSLTVTPPAVIVPAPQQEPAPVTRTATPRPAPAKAETQIPRTAPTRDAAPDIRVTGKAITEATDTTARKSRRAVSGLLKGVVGFLDSALSLFEAKPVRTPEQLKQDAKDDAADRAEQDQRDAMDAKADADRERVLREYRDGNRAKELEIEARKRLEKSQEHDYGGRERER